LIGKERTKVRARGKRGGGEKKRKKREPGMYLLFFLRKLLTIECGEERGRDGNDEGRQGKKKKKARTMTSPKFPSKITFCLERRGEVAALRKRKKEEEGVRRGRSSLLYLTPANASARKKS